MTLEPQTQNSLLDSFNETRNTTLQLVKNLENHMISQKEEYCLGQQLMRSWCTLIKLQIELGK